jgi:hypothetical protein
MNDEGTRLMNICIFSMHWPAAVDIPIDSDLTEQPRFRQWNEQVEFHQGYQGVTAGRATFSAAWRCE